jgi:hypothetical protein
MVENGLLLARDGVAGIFVAAVWSWILRRLWHLTRLWFPNDSIELRGAATILVIWALLSATSTLLIGCLNGWLLHILIGAEVGMTALWFQRRDRGGMEKSTVSGARYDVYRWRNAVVIALLALWATHVSVFGICDLPRDWDSLAYHMPIVDHWIQTGNLWNQSCAFWYVPGNNELWAYLIVAPFSGDFCINLNNVPTVLLFGFSLLAWGRELGMPNGVNAMLLVSISVTQPVWRQSISAENDVAVAALAIASVLFATRFLAQSALTDLLFFGMAVGLLGGIKYYALGYMGILVLIPVGIQFLTGSQTLQKRVGDVIRLLVVAGLGFLICGSVWYWRNWWFTGTPLYPKGILGMPDAWSEMRPGSNLSTLRQGADFDIWKTLIACWLKQAGPLPTFAMLFAPLTIIGVWNSRMRRTRLSLRFLSLCLLGSIAVYYVTPNVIETKLGTRNMLQLQYHPIRFGMVPMCFSLVGVACVWTDWIRSSSRKLRIISRIAATVAIGMIFSQVIWHTMPILGWMQGCEVFNANLWSPSTKSFSAAEFLLIVANVALVGMLVSDFLSSRNALAKWWPTLFICMANCISTMGLSHAWHTRFTKFYERRFHSQVLEQVAAHMSTTPTETLLACDYLYYPLLGSHRQFQVIRPLWVPDKDRFLEFVRDHRVRYVLARNQDVHWQSLYQAIPTWADESPEVFIEVWRDPTFRLWSVRESRSAQPAIRLR